MRIITWNCKMAFRKKASHILKYRPDILVVPECEHPDKLIFPNDVARPTSMLWFGSNKNKGLAVFSYCEAKLSVLENHNPAFKHVVPIEVKLKRQKFTLYAVWANNPSDPDGRYVEQIWKAINFYSEQLHDKRIVLVGDFNSNTIWDRKRREGNHSNVVKFLEAKGIHSSYHIYHKQKQGKEKHPTFFTYHHLDKPYHLDYCFVSNDLKGRLHSVEIGKFKDWIKYSDHVPVVVTFK